MFRVGVVQHPPVFLNLDASVEKARGLVSEAASGGAQVVVFPETWLPGYPVWLDYAPRAALWDYAPAKALYRVLAQNSPAIPGPHLDTLKAMAHQHSVYLVMGAHERLGGTLHNTMILIADDGETMCIHRKLVPTYTERMVWGRGDGSTLGVLPSRHGTIGGLICWEHWMPLARAAMHAQSEVLHVAQWPGVKELHLLASRHYAFEGQCFVVAAGCILSKGEALDGIDSLDAREPEARSLLESMPGRPDELLLPGGSAVIGPDAMYVSGPLYGEAGIVYADVDPARIEEGHLALDTNGHYARPDVFRLEVDDRPQPGVVFLSGAGGAGAQMGNEINDNPIKQSERHNREGIDGR